MGRSVQTSVAVAVRRFPLRTTYPVPPPEKASAFVIAADEGVRTMERCRQVSENWSSPRHTVTVFRTILLFTLTESTTVVFVSAALTVATWWPSRHEKCSPRSSSALEFAVGSMDFGDTLQERDAPETPLNEAV